MNLNDYNFGDYSKDYIDMDLYWWTVGAFFHTRTKSDKGELVIDHPLFDRIYYNLKSKSKYYIKYKNKDGKTLYKLNKRKLGKVMVKAMVEIVRVSYPAWGNYPKPLKDYTVEQKKKIKKCIVDLYKRYKDDLSPIDLKYVENAMFTKTGNHKEPNRWSDNRCNIMRRILVINHPNYNDERTTE